MAIILVPDANAPNVLTGAQLFPEAPVINGVPAGTFKPGRIAWNPVALVVASLIPVPTLDAAPTWSGTPTGGQTITFGNAVWTGTVQRREYRVLRNGSVIPGEIAASYVLRATDVGQVISRQERARSAPSGEWSAWATSTATPAIAAVAVPTNGPAVVTINEPPQDPLADPLVPTPRNRIIYDAGLVKGLNAAQIPISGTANEDGKPIYAKHPSMANWVQVSSGAVDGVWSGVLPVPTCDFGALQVLQADGSAVSRTTVCSSGLVMVVMAQSEVAFPIEGGSASGRFNGPNLARRNLQCAHMVALGDVGTEYTNIDFKWRDLPLVPTGPNSGPTAIFAEGPLRGAAKMLEVLRPDLNVYLIALLRGASSLRAFCDDTIPHRNFDRDKETYDLATLNGHIKPGCFVAPGSMSIQQQGEATLSLVGTGLTGRKPDGTPITPGEVYGGTADGGIASWRFDHHVTELLEDEDEECPLIVCGPHRYEWGGSPGFPRSNEPAVSSYRSHTGAIYIPWQQMALDELHTLYGRTEPGYDRIIEGGAVYHYQNGDPAGYGDVAHPAIMSIHGRVQYMTNSFGSWMIATGLTSMPVPKIDEISFTPQRITLGCSAGPLTTHRIHVDGVRGGPSNPENLIHRSEVIGVEINARPYPASITDDGKIQILPPPGQLWTVSDQVNYLTGNNVGAQALNADLDREVWKDVAGTPLPAPVPISAAADSLVTTEIMTAKRPPAQFVRGIRGNTLELPPHSVAININAATQIRDMEGRRHTSTAASSGIKEKVYTCSMRMRRRTGTSTSLPDLLGLGNTIRLGMAPSTGVVKIVNTDSTFVLPENGGPANNLTLTTIPLDQWVNVRLVVDFRNLSAVYVYAGFDLDDDGVFEVDNRWSGSANGTLLNGVQRFIALGTDIVADVHHVAFWEGAAQTALTPGVTPGLLPLIDAHKVIIGPASVALRQHNFIDGTGITDV